MSSISDAQALARSLENNGVRHVFFVTGSPLNLWPALEEEGIQLVLARSERAARRVPRAARPRSGQPHSRRRRTLDGFQPGGRDHTQSRVGARAEEIEKKQRVAAFCRAFQLLLLPIPISVSVILSLMERSAASSRAATGKHLVMNETLRFTQADIHSFDLEECLHESSCAA